MVRFLITGEESGGAYFVSEASVPPGGGPPLHIHRREDETFYILEGEVSFRVGDKTFTASEGDFVSAPRDTPHSFKNEGDRLVKMIVTCVPAGMERFFEEAFYPAPDPSTLPPPATRELIDRLIVTAPRHGLELVPPEEK
jgi:quercetin dioxygenase-like cupin family protein